VAAELVTRANSALERSGQKGEIQMLGKIAPSAGQLGDEEFESDLDDEVSGEFDDDDFDEPANPAVQPEDSPIDIDRFPDGVTIRVPPAGIRKGSSGLFFFSLLWNGFMTMFTVCTGYAMLSGQAQDAEGNEWIFAAVISLFWLVGIGMLVGAINMGRRQAALAVTGGRLLAMQTGLFGKKQREWPASEIKLIAAGPSGMEMNDVPILELQITDRSGKKLGILAGRADDELHWLAYELTQAVASAQAAGRD
jgi:hypothetical protein